jgi:hypothetical protein
MLYALLRLFSFNLVFDYEMDFFYHHCATSKTLKLQLRDGKALSHGVGVEHDEKRIRENQQRDRSFISIVSLLFAIQSSASFMTFPPLFPICRLQKTFNICDSAITTCITSPASHCDPFIGFVTWI